MTILHSQMHGPPHSVPGRSPGNVGVLRAAEDDACADAELVLAVALQVSELGVEVVGLQGADLSYAYRTQTLCWEPLPMKIRVSKPLLIYAAHEPSCVCRERNDYYSE